MTEYDKIYSSYINKINESKHHKIEIYTFLKKLPMLYGKKCLDLACGEGLYCRKLYEFGADSVKGVDISSKMIQMARQKGPKEIEYIIRDVAKLGKIDSYDVITGTYLLCYASTYDILKKFVKTIYDNLKIGGIFIGLNDNPSMLISNYDKTRKYGFWKSTECIELYDEDCLYWNWYINDDNSKIDKSQIWWYSRKTYEQVFRQCGFKKIEWFDMEFYENDYFLQDFLDYSPVIGIKAIK